MDTHLFVPNHRTSFNTVDKNIFIHALTMNAYTHTTIGDTFTYLMHFVSGITPINQKTGNMSLEWAEFQI